jgi:hypothetical protein
MDVLAFRFAQNYPARAARANKIDERPDRIDERADNPLGVSGFTWIAAGSRRWKARSVQRSSFRNML